MKFSLSLSEVHSKSSIKLHFKVSEHDLAKRWFKAFWRLIEKKQFLNKHATFLGLPEAQRNLRNIERDIFKQVEIINEALINQYYIDCSQKNKIDQELLNELHHHFETLIGQVWRPASFFKHSDHKTQIAIIFLNDYIHEYEYKLKALSDLKKNGPTSIASALNVSFAACEQYDLRPKDLSLFDLKRTFGDVYLHYSQLGKSYEEAFNDNDDKIDKDNISALRYYSGQFHVHLGQNSIDSELSVYKKNFHEWLEKQDLDPKNPYLGLGDIKVAKLVKLDHHKMNNPAKIRSILSRNWHITKIQASRWHRSVKCHYLYEPIDSSKYLEKFFKEAQWFN